MFITFYACSFDLRVTESLLTRLDVLVQPIVQLGLNYIFQSQMQYLNPRNFSPLIYSSLLFLRDKVHLHNTVLDTSPPSSQAKASTRCSIFLFDNRIFYPHLNSKLQTLLVSFNRNINVGFENLVETAWMNNQMEITIDWRKPCISTLGNGPE